MPRIKSYSKKDSIGKIIFSNELSQPCWFGYLDAFEDVIIVANFMHEQLDDAKIRLLNEYDRGYYHGYKKVLKFIDGE